MSKQHGRKTRVSTICLLFTLMFAVFGFVFHTRIQWVRTGASLAPAKLIIEKRSATVVAAPTSETDPSASAGAFYVMLASLSVTVPCQDVLRSFQADWGLRQSATLDGQGPTIMFRPPPIQL